MAGRSWASHFGQRSAETPPPPGPERPGLLARLVDLAKSWQAIAGALVVISGLWFAWADREAKRLAINQQAQAEARKAEKLALFWQDARSALDEFETAWPQHAVCVGLGVFLAEWGRAEDRWVSGSGDLPDTITLWSMQQARRPLFQKLRKIAAAEWASLDQVTVAAERVGLAAGDCLQVRADLPWASRQMVATECAGLLDSYASRMCEAAADQAQATDTARAVTKATAQTAPDLTVRAVSAAEPTGTRADCAPVDPMLIYVQVLNRADLERAQAVTDGLRERGWVLNDPYLVTDQVQTGEVRVYYPNQLPCGQALATDFASLAPGARALRVFVLDDEHTNMPIQRMELWLPDL